MSKARDIASAAPAPSTVSATELGYLDGVSSAIQTQLDAKTAKSTLTTTGDIYYASAANTPARLGIGSTGNVLTVASGIPSWAAPAAGGGMTLINTGGTTLSGSTTTISSIPGTYKELVIYVTDFVASSAYELTMRVNGDATSGYYQSFVNRGTGATNNTYVDNSSTFATFTGYSVSPYDNGNIAYAIIPNYADATTRKVINLFSGFIQNTNANAVCNNTCYYSASEAAITSLDFRTTNGTWSSGKVYVYGVN